MRNKSTWWVAGLLALATGMSQASLVLHYEFEDGSWGHEDPIAESAGTLPGGFPTGSSIDNGLGSTTWDNSATFGNAAVFSGGWRRVKLGNTGAATVGGITTDFTLATWAKSTGGSQDWHLYSSDNNGTDYNGYAFIIKTDGSMALNTGVGGGGAEYSVPGALYNDNTWHHLALTFADAGGGNYEAKFYVDGTQVGTTQTGTALPSAYNTSASTGAWGIGASEGGRHDAYGEMDDWRLYDNVLTESQIGNLIPEPTSAILLALGGVIGIAIRRRR